jgi:signal recognition particle receptor subunit beta
VPYVLQLNKRDLPNVISVDELAGELQRKGEPVFEAVAAQGTGGVDTLKAVARRVLTELGKC